jgi:GNAT superfamily N-acetyltransferase
MLIRPITEADIDEVAAVHLRAWQTGYVGIVPQDFLDALDPALFAERRRAHLAEPGVKALLAEEDGHVLGHTTFGPDRDGDPHGELWSIYVDPARWGHGAGRELLTAAKKELAAEGFTVMRLWVLTENHNARRFYERMGLRPDGATQTWAPRGTDVELPEMRYATPL